MSWLDTPPTLKGRGVAIYAVAADSADDTAKLQAKVAGVTLLRDPDLAVAAAWGVRVGDEDAPWPAVFVIGQGRRDPLPPPARHPRRLAGVRRRRAPPFASG